MTSSPDNDPFAERSALIAEDLEAFASHLRRSDRHLLLHRSVEERLVRHSTQLPEGTIDARGGDAVRLALIDESAVLVVSDGPNQWVTPPHREAGWDELVGTGRAIATLVNSRLSGRYWGLFTSDSTYPKTRGGRVLVDVS